MVFEDTPYERLKASELKKNVNHPDISSLTQRLFRKKRNGKIVIQCQELYLRKDIPCGVSTCPDCLPMIHKWSLKMNQYREGETIDAPSAIRIEGQVGEAVGEDVINLHGEHGCFGSGDPQPMEHSLSNSTASTLITAPKDLAYLRGNPRLGDSSLIRDPHILILDSSIFTNGQIDVIEDEVLGDDIIILQTVLEEVRSASLVLFSRLKKLQQQAHRRFYIFYNKHHRRTWRERDKSETTHEYMQRMVRVATKWYTLHLSPKAIKTVVLTCDPTMIDRCNQLEILCYDLESYVKSLKNGDLLLDKLAETIKMNQDANEEREKLLQFRYPTHIPLAKIQTGIKAGKYHQGKYLASRFNCQEGYVQITWTNPKTKIMEDVMILVSGREAINRAVHDDVVAIEVLPESMWKATSSKIVTPDDELEELIKEEQEGEEKPSEKPAEEPMATDEEEITRPTGRVVAIVRRNWRPLCGVLRPRNSAILDSIQLSTFIFIPIDKRMPLIRIKTRQYDRLKNQRLLVQMDKWPQDSRYPLGHYVRALGTVGDKETEYEVLLLEHNVPHEKFSAAVMRCLPTLEDPTCKEFPISESEMQRRVDLRHLDICSVDPPGCTDIDDALHCRVLDDGYWEAGVHIADVSHFVKPDTALDQEASNRGTTVYLVDRRIDMIPGLLSSNLCSLMPGVERLTFSVIWKIDPKTATVIEEETKFHKSVIRSRAAFTYAEAQNRIDNPSDKSELAESLRRLNHLAKLLKAKRLENGALVLASTSEIKFVEVESETHENVVQIEGKKMLETNSLIEEFMLLANIAVAAKLYKDMPELALLRRHPKPAASNFEPLLRAAKSRGFEFNVEDGKTLSASLEKAMDPKNDMLNLMLRMMTTYCMTQALYFCSGTLSAEDLTVFGHFGIASPIYTHFTSPIRRYADLVVHRLLSHCIGMEALKSTMLSKTKLQHMADHLNQRHKNAQYAGRASVNLHTIMYIRNSPTPVIESAHIFDVKKNAMIIFIPRLALHHTYNLKPQELWQFNEHEDTQRHTPTGTLFRRFDPVKVHLTALSEDASHEGPTNRDRVV